MNKSEVGVELVKYRTEELSNSARSFVQHFAKYSGIPHTEAWSMALPVLDILIKNEEPNSLKLDAEGISLRYSGMPRPIPQIVTENDESHVIYKAKDPRFTIDYKLHEVSLPSERVKIWKATSDIVDEMKNVYDVDILKDPLQVVFSRRAYAKETVMSQGVPIFLFS